MKDLIMAVSYGYTHSQLKVFTRSLAETGFAGDLVLFIGGTDVRSKELLREEGAVLVPFFYPYRHCNKLRTPFYRLWPLVCPLLARSGDAGTVQRLAAPFLNLSILRFAFYRSYLLRHFSEYGRVFLTDLRDVCFQDDPFRRVATDELRVFLEEPGHVLGDCANNSRWLSELYGSEVLGELSQKPIICSGTILGGRQRMLDYLDAFILSLREARSVMRMGMDQGMHNYIVYRGLAGAVTFCENRQAEILTMGLMPEGHLPPCSNRGHFLDGQGEPYAVLHQFDRHEGVRQKILSIYN